MRFPIERFNCAYIANHNPWLDVTLYDDFPGKLRREWRITYDGLCNEWYGVLLRADSDEDDFEKAVELSDNVVSSLVPMVLHYLEHIAAFNSYRSK